MSETFVDITGDDAGSGWWDRLRPQLLSGAPGWFFLPLVLATAGATLVSETAPGTWFLLSLLAMAAWLVLGLAFVVKLGLALLVGEGRAGLRRTWWRWLAAPLLVVVVAGMLTTQVPLRVAVTAAAPQIQHYAQHPDAQAPSWAGIYAISDVERMPDGGARFIVDGANFMDLAGFAYSPKDQLRDSERDNYEHLTGPWYVWYKYS